jgi:uncharacterized protein with NAD-binding domain and iron-sulfur cluster
VDTDVLVIGGGIAGLAAAKNLADAGLSAVVLEKRDVNGGKLSSWRDRDGDWLESGLHSFFGGYDQLQAMLKEVGIFNNVLWQPHALTFAMPSGVGGADGEAIFEEFKFLDTMPAPFNGVGAVLKAKHVFLPMEKLLFAKGTLPILMRDAAYSLRQDDMTYSEWHRRRGMTERMLQIFFAPMALALNFTPADVISAHAMLQVMTYFASGKNASRPGFLDGPPSLRLIDPIVEYVTARGQQVITRSRVAELTFDGDGVTGARTHDGREFRARAVILATPVHDAARLLPPAMLADPLVSGVGKLTASPVINGHFWFDRPISPRSGLIFGAGTLVPVHADLGQASPGYEWRDRSFVEACIAPADDLIALDDETIVNKVLDDMRKLYPLATREHLVKAKLVRIPRSVYRALPGSQKYRPGARTPARNLFLAGCYTDHGFPASIEGAVRSARTAVDAARAVVGERAAVLA